MKAIWLGNNRIEKIENMESFWLLETLGLQKNLITSVPKIDWFGNSNVIDQVVHFSDNPLVNITELQNFGNTRIFVEADPKYEELPGFIRYTASNHAIIDPRPD